MYFQWDLFRRHIKKWVYVAKNGFKWLYFGMGKTQKYTNVRLSIRPSSVHPSTISNDFSSVTTGPIATKFHIQPPCTLGKKIYSNGLGHMTNMAAMPIYG